MKRFLTLIPLLIIFSLFETTVQAQEPTLYKRIGGYDAIVAVTNDFVGRLVTNKDLSRFFVGMSDDSKIKVSSHIINLVCKVTGGSCPYTGRDMKTVHTGLHITENDWTIMAGLFSETLNKFNVPKKEQDELFTIVGSVKKDIVGK
ncbi:MAG TPA: group 1 truncated hemoglobin [Ferruginibacter sp.]|nr:group 1 truncated hemoglobin [Ferruginibacter sp.]